MIIKPKRMTYWRLFPPTQGFYDANGGPHPLGGLLDQKVWAETLKLSWVSDWKLFGGTYSDFLF